MAHILQVRQSGVVVALKLSADKGTVAFHAEVFKWDDAQAAPVRVGDRRFTLPQTLFKNLTVSVLRERIGATLPPCLPGSEYKGNIIKDDATLVSLDIAPKDKESVEVYLVFNLNKNAGAAAPAAASAGETPSSPRGTAPTSSSSTSSAPPASVSSPRLNTPTPVKTANSGAITYEREYPVTITITCDAGNSFVNVGFGGKEEKYIIADNTLATMTVKELKRKLGKQLPETTDRSSLEAASGSKAVKDSDKLGALGVKGKKGESFKFQFMFELVTAGSGGGEPAPEIDAAKQFPVEVVTFTQDNHVYLKLNCKAEGYTDVVKSAAFQKTMFGNFALRDLLNLLKGGQVPTLNTSWAVFEMPNGSKIKVGENVPLTKLGIQYSPTPGKNTEYNFTFVKE